MRVYSISHPGGQLQSFHLKGQQQLYQADEQIIQAEINTQCCHDVIGFTAIYDTVHIKQDESEKTNTATAEIASEIAGMARNKLTREAKITRIIPASKNCQEN